MLHKTKQPFILATAACLPIKYATIMHQCIKKILCIFSSKHFRNVYILYIYILYYILICCFDSFMPAVFHRALAALQHVNTKLGGQATRQRGTHQDSRNAIHCDLFCTNDVQASWAPALLAFWP